jgi:hypothetical protein
MKGKQMTELTKIEKPYAFCTKEEQQGLNALVGKEGALQRMISTGEWEIPHPRIQSGLYRGIVYRQNPNWQPPKLDVPDWFWENTDYNYVAMNPDGSVYGHKNKPDTPSQMYWLSIDRPVSHTQPKPRLDEIFINHNFNPHKIPWHQSLTVRPGFEE